MAQTTLSQKAGVVRHDILQGPELEKCTKALIRFIVDAKLSFRIVQSKAFRSYVATLNKHIPTVRRRTLVRLIQGEHMEKMEIINQTLSDIKSNIAITCDGWSSRVYRE